VGSSGASASSSGMGQEDGGEADAAGPEDATVDGGPSDSGADGAARGDGEAFDAAGRDAERGRDAEGHGDAEPQDGAPVSSDGESPEGQTDCACGVGNDGAPLEE
jgi:hypothetical protein